MKDQGGENRQSCLQTSVLMRRSTEGVHDELQPLSRRI